MTRAQKLKLIYAQTHRDYKTKLDDGTKAICVLREGGTQLVALDALTDAEVEKKWVAANVIAARKAEMKKQKANDKIIEAAYYATCAGIQINVLDIPKVFEAGRLQLAVNPDFGALKLAIRDYVETIRKN